MRRLALGTIVAMWIAAMAAILVLMLIRISTAARMDSEQKIQGQTRHIIVQHLTAALILGITFAIFLYSMHVWWGY